MRAHKLHALGLALLAVSFAGALPLVTSSSFSDTTVNNSNLISAAPDWVPPSVTAAAVAKSAGGTAGFIKASGTYYVYASATDSGAPASGIGTVKADVSTITTGQTAVTLVAGSYSAGGVSYGYRSAQLTAKATLATGPVAFSITATDQVPLSATAAFSVTGDNTVPSASDIQTTNVAGGTAATPELGDTLILTYNEVIDWTTILSGWNGTTTNVQLKMIDAGGPANDYIEVYTPSQVLLPLGTIDLGAADFIKGGAGLVVFGATGTPTGMTASGSTLTLVLGTPNVAAGTEKNANAMTWTPATGVTDRAGNAISLTPRIESGTSDKDF
jgi:chitinase